MADNTAIEWTDATWNPITGCSVVSPGCTNCYAMKLAGSRLKHTPSRQGLTIDSKAGPVWNGQVRLNADQLTQPLRWKRPRRIFVCAHGDLFHKSVPDAWIDQVFAVMALSPQHTFQVLTKRAERMRAYMDQAAGRIADTIIRTRRARGDHGVVVPLPHIPPGAPWWPLPNVHLGVSAEDQARADERIPHLLATPAAVRFLSAEPLLGAIDVMPHLFIYTHADTAALDLDVPVDLPFRDPATTPPEDIDTPRLDWVIVGGESGPGARPMHPDWARQIRDAGADAGVPFFFKQWGSHAWAERIEGDPSTLTAYRTGKRTAGRLLDGVEHNAMPGGHHAE